MLTQKEEKFIEELARWAESVGINLDRDPEQL